MILVGFPTNQSQRSPFDAVILRAPPFFSRVLRTGRPDWGVIFDSFVPLTIRPFVRFRPSFFVPANIPPRIIVARLRLGSSSTGGFRKSNLLFGIGLSLLTRRRKLATVSPLALIHQNTNNSSDPRPGDYIFDKPVYATSLKVGRRWRGLA